MVYRTAWGIIGCTAAVLVLGASCRFVGEATRAPSAVHSNIVEAAESDLPSQSWGLHIVVLDVGQADAIVAVGANGDAMIVDAGHGSSAANRILKFLADPELNGVKVITAVKAVVVTHYDLDHVGGVDDVISSEAVIVGRSYDQGPSKKRVGKTNYLKYLHAVGDPNDNMQGDDGADASPFIRVKSRPGLHWNIGDARVRIVSAMGDTKGSAHDLSLDPSEEDIDENPGSVSLLVTLGDFEFYTAGDQTSDDWRSEADVEMGVVDSTTLGATNDIDVLKVNHHGSDTSSGHAFVNALDPEVAIITAKFNPVHRLPRMVVVKQLVENGASVFVTGDGLSPSTGQFSDSAHSEDDGYEPPEGKVVNESGDVHIYVNADGTGYSLQYGETIKQFSAIDADNPHP